MMVLNFEISQYLNIFHHLGSKQYILCSWSQCPQPLSTSLTLYCFDRPKRILGSLNFESCVPSRNQWVKSFCMRYLTNQWWVYQELTFHGQSLKTQCTLCGQSLSNAKKPPDLYHMRRFFNISATRRDRGMRLTPFERKLKSESGW